MAINRFSNYNFNTVVPSPLNLDAAYSVNAELQNNYDQGFLKVATQLQSLNSLPIIAERDKEFINQRVRAITDQLDGYGNVNYADPKEVAGLELQVDSVLRDPEVKRKIRNNQYILQVQERRQKLKENPKLMDKHSDLLEQYDNEIIQSYIRGDIDNMPISSPTLYKDLNKFGNEIAKSIAPKIQSQIGDDFIMEGKYRHKIDIIDAVASGLKGDAASLNQMRIEASMLAKNMDASDLYNYAIMDKKGTLQQYEQAAKRYEDAVAKEPNIDSKGEYKSRYDAIKSSITDLKKEIENLQNASLTGSKEDAMSAFNTAYQNNFIKWIATANEVSEERVKGVNPFKMESVKNLNALTRLKLQQDFLAAENQKKLEASKEREIMRMQKALLTSTGKTASGSDIDRLLRGESINLGNVSDIPTNVNTEDPLSEIKNEQDLSQGKISGYLSELAMTYIEGFSPEYAIKVREVWNPSNRTKIPNAPFSTNQKLLQIVNAANEIIESATDPKKITSVLNNPDLSKYSELLNAIEIEGMKRDLIAKEYQDAENDAYKDYKKERGFTGSLEDFRNILKDEGKSKTITTPFGSFQTLPTNSDPVTRLKDRINEKLKQRNYTTFNKRVTIAEKDKDWNNGGERNSTVKNYLREEGIVIDGKQYGIDGKIRDKTSKKNLDIGLENSEVVVNGWIAGSNMIDVTIKNKETKKSERGFLQLAPENFSRLTGYIPPVDDKDLAIAMNRSGRKVLSNSDGSWKYLNAIPTYNSVPEVGVQYTLESTPENEFNILIKIPTDNGSFSHKYLKDRNGKISISSLRQAQSLILGTMGAIRNEVLSMPNIDKTQVGTITWENFKKSLL